MERLLELARERKLDRVGATYAVVAWILVQAASIALPAFAAPAWVLRWLIVAAMAGFPLVLAGAWVSLGRAPATPEQRSFDRKDWLLTGLIGLVAVLLVVQLALGFSWRNAASPQQMPQQVASSVAVLPFANLSGDPSKIYFSDGIADQLISELARTPSLRVAARTSSFAFRGKEVDVKTIAKALNVRSVLEGSVREDGNRVRIAAELVDASNGFEIWSQTYDRDLTSILALQDEIAGSISRALNQRFWGKPGAPAQPVLRPRIDPEVYKVYLQGQYYLAQRTRDGVTRAIDLFKRVTEMAPDYPDGIASLADAKSVDALNFEKLDQVSAAATAASKALALDPRNPTALLARTRISLLQWRWRAVADDLRQLDKLHVNTAILWRTRAVFFDYMGLPQFSGAAEQKAVQLDPLSFLDHYNLALYAMLAKHYDQAMKFAGESLTLQPGNSEVLTLQCEIETMRGRVSEARKIYNKLAALSKPGDPPGDEAGCLFYIEVAEKNYAAAHKIVDMAAAAFPASGISATDLGIGYTRANDLDSAIKWYRRALEVRDPQVFRVPYFDKDMTKLFADPRWKALRDTPAVRDWEQARRGIAREFQMGE